MMEMNKEDLKHRMRRVLETYFYNSKMDFDIKCNKCIEVFIKPSRSFRFMWFFYSKKEREEFFTDIGRNLDLPLLGYKVNITLYYHRMKYEPINH